MSMQAHDWSPLLLGLPLPAIVVEAGAKVIACNDLATGLLGPGILGRNPAMAVRSPALLDAIGEVALGGESQQVRVSLRRDGQEDVFQVTVSGQAESCALCVFRDVSEEEKVDAMRRDFVANVSHELRTPLTALMGFIETLRHAAKDDPKAREMFLGIMETEAGRMNRLVRDLLQLSQVEANERVRPTERVELRGLLERVIGSLRGVAEKTGDTVVLTGEAVTVPGDHDQLTQVFTNLIENALKYGAAGQVVRVTLSPEETVRGPAVRVEVADQGEGIDPVHLPRLTERFYRVNASSSRAKGGTGLGLAIVHRIISDHGGRIVISDPPGGGARVLVELPLKPGQLLLASRV